MARTKSKKKTFSKIISTILVLITIIFLFFTYFLNLMPLKYFIFIILLLIVFNTIIVILNLNKKKSKRIIGYILSIILIAVLSAGSFYEFVTLGFFSNFSKMNYKTLNYNVLVLNNSEYENIKDLKQKQIGSLKGDHYGDAVETLTKKIKFYNKEYKNIDDLLKDLTSKNLDAIILEESQYIILEEENSGDIKKFKKLYNFSIDIKTEDIEKEVNVTKEPFNIYISGIDSYGKITSVSRSDVNIVVTVDPKTNKIILTSIPRDYYVQLHDTTGYKDKLTHAGVYGIEKSVQTIEDLLEIDINYYIKVNFSSLVKIVDELGGIKVDSKYSFTSRDGYTYHLGENNLNGKEALSFVRERKAFKDGDRVRGENQQIVLTALINKIVSPNIITKYNNLLNALEGSFITNMDDKDITSLIKKQIENNNSWSFSTINLDGVDAYDYTYTHSASKLYVMVPLEESLNNAKEKLHEILK